MDKYKILVQGYAKEVDSKYFASCTTILIESKGRKVLVDPGADKEALLSALDGEGLAVNDIDILFLTHYHPDHFLNIRLFPNVDTTDGYTIWKDTGEEVFSDEGSAMKYIPETNIEILPTSGHREEHVSLLINTREEGTACIAQDVFWWEDGKQPDNPTYDELIELEDPYLLDKEELIKSRRLVLEKADWIIPGHGKKFKNLLKK